MKKMSRRISIGDITWVEYERRIEKDTPVVIVPVGSTEQHGPHSPNSSDELLDKVFPDGFPGSALKHAGVMTTALHLHLTPDLVDRSKAPTHGPIDFPPYDVFPYEGAAGTETGCLNSPKTASAESGKLIFDHVVSALGSVIGTEFGH